MRLSDASQGRAANKRGQVARGGRGAAASAQQPGVRLAYLLRAPNAGLKCRPRPHVCTVHGFQGEIRPQFSRRTRSVTLLRLIWPGISQLFVSRTKGLDILPAFDPWIWSESPAAFGEVFPALSRDSNPSGELRKPDVILTLIGC